MDFEKYTDRLFCTGIVPVIKLEEESDAVALAGALRAGGIYATPRSTRARSFASRRGSTPRWQSTV